MPALASKLDIPRRYQPVLKTSKRLIEQSHTSSPTWKPRFCPTWCSASRSSPFLCALWTCLLILLHLHRIEARDCEGLRDRDVGARVTCLGCLLAANSHTSPAGAAASVAAAHTHHFAPCFILSLKKIHLLAYTVAWLQSMLCLGELATISANVNLLMYTWPRGWLEPGRSGVSMQRRVESCCPLILQGQARLFSSYRLLKGSD